MTFDELWEKIKEHQKEPFCTVRGLEYTYSVKGGCLFISRKEKEITRATVELAYHEAAKLDWKVDGPKKLKSFGASYLYPIFIGLGLIRTTEKEYNMEFTQVIKERFSCKKYSSRQVEDEKLQAILEAGRLAPTAKNLQEQRIYVAQSPEALAKIDQATPCRYGAPTVLVVAYDRENMFTYPGGKHTTGVEDATIVADHMMLAASNAGVDSCWLNLFDPEELKKLLGLPENEEIVMLLDLGYGADGAGPLPNHGKRKAIEETVVYI